MSIDEKIKKARLFSKILQQEKYETPHNKIKNVEYMLENSSFSEEKVPKSIGNSPSLPKIINKRNLKSSSPSKLKLMNNYKEKTDKKSIFFPKIDKIHVIEKNLDSNEFIEEKNNFLNDNANFFKRGKGLEKFQGKVFRNFPKDFFPFSE